MAHAAGTLDRAAGLAFDLGDDTQWLLYDMLLTQTRTPRRADAPPLAGATETGALGIFGLKRLWSRAMRARESVFDPATELERHLDHLVIHACGLGLEQTLDYFAREAPAFDAFERWIVATTGGVAPERVARINAAVAGTDYPESIRRWLADVEQSAPVLSADDLAFWDAHGYVVLHNAVPADTCAAAAHALWRHLGAREDDPESWYRRGDHGIMVQVFQHPAFEANRRAARIHKAFAQLWGTPDLWMTTDRVGFNPPEREGFTFPGPDLHWDCSVKTPIPFGTQGILYLADTAPEQGAFTLVPGFQRWGEDWLKDLPPGADPRRQDLHALGAIPIGGRAGDLIIWHQALPHGASPNRGLRPRLVQYLAMFPARMDFQEEWI